ncbi:MAG TPA: hypothetical protein VN616_09990, partial [Puia sp.]|nr:hypothetical protein [Puia sp.]
MHRLWEPVSNPLRRLIFIAGAAACTTTNAQIPTHMEAHPGHLQHATIGDDGEVTVQPSPDSKATDFDFLMGAHRVHHEKLKYRLAGCQEWVASEGTHQMQPLLGGFGNLEQHRMTGLDGRPAEGVALRLFDPKTRLWSIYWADSKAVALGNPVVGSFEHRVGYFYGRDTLNGRPIWVQFCWDARDSLHPVWSQAFSADKGKTWEWNWVMRFSPAGAEGSGLTEEATADSNGIGLIELRDYLIKPGDRDRFIAYFEANFIGSQDVLGGSVLGQYRVKDHADNFCWVRGFRNMASRSAFLPGFYYGPFWKQHRNVANGMLVNNDNVYLLRPLQWKNDSLIPVASIDRDLLYPGEGIAVVDFYISNTKLDKL